MVFGTHSEMGHSAGGQVTTQICYREEDSPVPTCLPLGSLRTLSTSLNPLGSKSAYMCNGVGAWRGVKSLVTRCLHKAQDPTCNVRSCSLCRTFGPRQAIPCLGAAGGPEGGWGLHGAHKERGMVSLIALGLRILGTCPWSLSRKMPWPDDWDAWRLQEVLF